MSKHVSARRAARAAPASRQAGGDGDWSSRHGAPVAVCVQTAQCATATRPTPLQASLSGASVGDAWTAVGRDAWAPPSGGSPRRQQRSAAGLPIRPPRRGQHPCGQASTGARRDGAQRSGSRATGKGPLRRLRVALAHGRRVRGARYQVRRNGATGWTLARHPRVRPNKNAPRGRRLTISDCDPRGRVPARAGRGGRGPRGPKRAARR
jgi:hypothetical protein